MSTMLPAILLGLALLIPSPGAAEDSVSLESSRRVLLQRHNTVGGWEIHASLNRNPDTGKAWIDLQVNDMANPGKKTLDIPHIDFLIDRETSLRVECGDAEDAERWGGGLVFRNTLSSHACQLGPAEVNSLLSAKQIASTVTVNGKQRKTRSWSPKAVGKFTTLELLNQPH